MNTKLKLVTGGLLLAGSLAVTPAFAVSDCAGPGGLGVGSGEGGILLDLINASGSQCQDQDKIYTYISQAGNLSLDNLGLQISYIALPGGDQHDITFSAPSGQTGAYPFAGIYELKYSIEIVDSDKIFSEASMGVLAAGANRNNDVTKMVYSDAAFSNLVLTLLSTNSTSPIGPVGIPGGLTKLYVHDIFDVGGLANGGVLQGVVQTYTQAEVPEPSVLSLFALGLLGLGVRARNRRA